MSALTASGSVLASTQGKTPYFAIKLVASGLILATGGRCLPRFQQSAGDRYCLHGIIAQTRG
jgi:hypothetical protein